MAFSSRRNRQKQVISEINITPFVDVLLVLLIIFMVAAPMMTSNIDVSLPEGSTKPSNEKTQPVAVTIKNNGTIFINEKPIKLANLPKEISKITNRDLKSKIHVRADKSLDYGRVMEVVKKINMAGFNQVSLITQLSR